MTKQQAEKRAGELNAMAKKDEYKAMVTHTGEWFVARSFTAILNDGHESRRYTGISIS